MIEIDEIISNAEYCADVYERMNKAMPPALQVSDYKRYAEDHRQLAEWLRDYKRLKEREPKTGYWEKTTDRYSYWYRCSYCGERIPKNFWGNNYFSPYCPECGAQMVEPQESEDV